MLDLAGGTNVYLACGVTDLRKSYNGLAAIIKLKFHLDPYSRCMFAFCKPQAHFYQNPSMGRIRFLDPYVLFIEFYDFFEVCDVASSAYLPHSGKSRLGCEAGTVMKFVFIPFVYCWRAGTD